MKSRKAQIHAKYHKVPRIVFEEGNGLTSYAGLVVFQRLFQVLQLKARLRKCFAHLGKGRVFGHATVLLMLVVHLLLGFRRLRGRDFYCNDPLVLRLLGLRSVPDVSTVTRTLHALDSTGVENSRALVRELVCDRLKIEGFSRLTLDFDGSVQSTKGHAEGTAVGFNKVKKGARSYYPLFCTVAQTSQFFDCHHRPGNVHDSNGAAAFMKECISQTRAWCPSAVLESRMDSAFFSEEIIETLVQEAVEFTASVPFERLPELKEKITQRKRWRRIDREWSYFEVIWKPKSWSKRYRFIFVRRRRKVQLKGPLQLDLFEPRDFEYEYKVIVTNRTDAASAVIQFHNGRGSQEKLFGEAKQHAALGVVATSRRLGNQLFTVASMLAHNLTRELQMRTWMPGCCAGPKRAAVWEFLSLGGLRQRILHRAGLLVRPQGELTLKMNANTAVEDEMHAYLEALEEAA